jgi:hypothetical protein
MCISDYDPTINLGVFGFRPTPLFSTTRFRILLHDLLPLLWVLTGFALRPT